MGGYFNSDDKCDFLMLLETRRPYQICLMAESNKQKIGIFDPVVLNELSVIITHSRIRTWFFLHTQVVLKAGDRIVVGDF